MEQAETSEVVFMLDKREWWETVDPARLGEDTRYRILAYVVERHRRKKVLEETGISGSPSGGSWRGNHPSNLSTSSHC